MTYEHQQLGCLGRPPNGSLQQRNSPEEAGRITRKGRDHGSRKAKEPSLTRAWVVPDPGGSGHRSVVRLRLRGRRRSKHVPAGGTCRAGARAGSSRARTRATGGAGRGAAGGSTTTAGGACSPRARSRRAGHGRRASAGAVHVRGICPRRRLDADLRHRPAEARGNVRRSHRDFVQGESLGSRSRRAGHRHRNPRRCRRADQHQLRTRRTVHRSRRSQPGRLFHLQPVGQPRWPRQLLRLRERARGRVLHRRSRGRSHDRAGGQPWDGSTPSPSRTTSGRSMGSPSVCNSRIPLQGSASSSRTTGWTRICRPRRRAASWTPGVTFMATSLPSPGHRRGSSRTLRGAVSPGVQVDCQQRTRRRCDGRHFAEYDWGPQIASLHPVHLRRRTSTHRVLLRGHGRRRHHTSPTGDRSTTRLSDEEKAHRWRARSSGSPAAPAQVFTGPLSDIHGNEILADGEVMGVAGLRSMAVGHAERRRASTSDRRPGGTTVIDVAEPSTEPGTRRG